MGTFHPLPTKVSSISNTNENRGVSITRSHEVPGKSSTDGTSSAAGKSGSLSLDALAKAKKALQMQKELAEKLKKIPLVSSHLLYIYKTFICCYLWNESLLAHLNLHLLFSVLYFPVRF